MRHSLRFDGKSDGTGLCQRHDQGRYQFGELCDGLSAGDVPPCDYRTDDADVPAWVEQGTAADILKKAMVEIFNEFNKRNLKSKMLIQVHDELVFNVLNSELDEVKEIVKDIMENTFKLEVPLKVDIEYGNNWYEAK